MRLPRAFWLTAAACGILALPLHAVQAGDRNAARAALTRGVAALGAGDARTARIELLNAIKADPDWVEPRVAQARAMLALNDGAGAQAELERARALRMAPAQTRAMMAHALLLQGDAAGAVREATASDVPAGDAAYAVRMTGKAYLALGDISSATLAFNQVMALAPRDSAVWADVGRFRFAIGDLAGAIAAVDKAVALDQRNADAVNFRAVLIRDQYGLRAALPWFERALEIEPNFVPALVEYAATLCDLGEAQAMLSLTRRVIALDARNPRPFFMQAVMAARAGQYDLARGMLRRTGGALDMQPAAMLLNGVLQLESGNAGLAVQQFERLLRIQPFNLRARALLGRAYMVSGDAIAAAQALAPLVERPDADSYDLTLAARAQEQLGNRALASTLLARAASPVRGDASVFAGAGNPQMLARAANADPASPAAVIPMVRALLETGQVDAAIARAQTLRDANPGAPDAHILLGDALSVSGQHRAAAAAYERAANIRFSENTVLRIVSAWRRAGEPVKATVALNLYLDQNPGSVAANRLAANAHMEAENWTDALAILESLRSRMGNNDVMLLSDLAWAYLGRGNADRALAFAKAAYKLQPASPVATDIYGWTLFKARGSTRASIDLLEKAVAMAPRHPLLQLHLGQAYAAAGDVKGARVALKLAASTTGFAQAGEARAALAKL